MTETVSKMCRICLKSNKYDHINDSSCYAKFFNKVMALEEFNESLWLCIWCKAALKRSVALFSLALESEKIRRGQIRIDNLNNSKSLYALKKVSSSNLDIPSFDIIQPSEAPIIQEKSEVADPLRKLKNETEIPQKRNKKKSKHNKMKLLESRIEDTSTDILSVEDEIEIKKGIKKQLNYSELNFEVEYLNLEEQLKEVEMKRVKYKDFQFQCSYCGLAFPTSDVFEEHKIRHSEVTGPYSCNICSLHFKSQDVLSHHVLAHKRRFKCLLCNAVLKRWQHCAIHRYKCGAVVEPISCEECLKIFNNKYALRIHTKIHKRDQKYCCDQCDRKFVSKQRLIVHIRSHTGVKPYTCDRCSRSFTTSSNLRAHSSVHSEDNVHYCVECHTFYKTAKSLKRHFNESARHMNTNSVMYSCKNCSKQFPTEKSLKYHINARHRTEHRCSLCDKTFSNNSNLNKHIKCIHINKNVNKD